MPLIILSFVAGILTVLAPCVLPLLPVIIGSSVSDEDKYKPYLVIAGLVGSITLFTVLLKAGTLLIGVDPLVWKIISGSIVILFGINYLFPQLWDTINVYLGLSKNSDNLLNQAEKKRGVIGSLLIGGALGPVFASCSPTYALIIATILPVNLVEGLIYILVYNIGLALIMLLVILLGRQFIQKVKIFSNPNGIFKKTIGVIFILVGLSVIFGWDKALETYLLTSGIFDITVIEQQLLDSLGR